jgi:hypothetical protein
MIQDRDRKQDHQEDGQVDLNAEQALGVVAQSVDPAPPRHEDVPTIWKIFGGAIVSIIFMLIITIFGYIINNVTNLQTSINCLNADTVKKTEFNERVTTIWGTLKQVDTIKDRLTTVEQRTPVIDNLKDRATTADQKVLTLEAQLKTMQEESRSQAKDIQNLRERLAVIEASRK